MSETDKDNSNKNYHQKAFYEDTMVRIRFAAFMLGFTLATFLLVSSLQAAEDLIGPQEPPLLREHIVVADEIVYLSDLFENVGTAGDKAVFRSPDLGQEGVISAERIREAAIRHGLQWPNLSGVDTVLIRRASREISAGDIKKLISEVLARKVGAEDSGSLEITYAGDVQPIHAPVNLTAPTVIKSLRHNERSGSFRVVVGIDGDKYKRNDRIYRGRAFKTSVVYVPRKALQPGETITEADLKPKKLPERRLGAKVAREMQQLVGKAAKRRVRAEEPVLLSDLQEPLLVRNNGLVDIVFNTSGLLLKAEGRSLEDGALGDTVKVINTHSKKTVTATVTGAGLVSVSRPYRRSAPQRVSSRSVPKSTPSEPVRGGWEAVYKIRR